MRLVSYESGTGLRAGIVAGDRVVDAALALDGGGTPLDSVRGILAAGIGPERLRAAADAAGGDVGALADLRLGPPRPGPERLRAAADAADGDVGALADLRLGPPVPDPERILCIGLNYKAHADETGFEAPPAPTIFPKFRNSLVGDRAPIVVPEAAAGEVDFEGELAIVIGRG